MTEKPTDNSEKKFPARDGAGETGTGPVIPAAREGTTKIRNHPAPHLVQRATGLRGLGIGRPPEPKSSVRRRTQADIYGKDPEIPYVKYEMISRDLICSLMERQDRMNEAIFYRINDLGYRLEDLEERMAASGGGS
jgi:hypothetical protein